jgi:AraC family transcriptional regulator
MMKANADNDAHALVRSSADAYAQALAFAGGKQLETLMCQGDRSALCAATYASPPYDLQVPALPVSRLSITLTPARVSGGLDGDRRQAFQSLRYAVFVAPTGAAAHWHKESTSRHLNLYFHAGALADREVGTQGLTLDCAPPLNVCVPGIRTLADELVAELQAGPLWSAEAVDSLGRLLLIKVARHRAQHRAARNPLTPQLLGRMVEHVQAHLSERILVSDLAAVVGLSPNHFAHAYTACTGQSPHQFVMAKRLQHAQALLQNDREPLADVAAASGFANQQHLTNVMRKQLGVTPARYRHEQQAGRRAHILGTGRLWSGDFQGQSSS